MIRLTSNAAVKLVVLILAVWPSRHAAGQLPPLPEPGADQPVAKPEIFVAQRLVELGTVLSGDKPTISWILENRGDADLIIERTRASCGCTVVRLKDEEHNKPGPVGWPAKIRPGDSLTLKADFDSTGRSGAQTKTVTVYSNDPLEPELKLRFTATVKRLYEIKPIGMMNLRGVHRGETAAKAIEIIPGAGWKSVRILDLHATEGAPFGLTHEPCDDDRGTTGRAGSSAGGLTGPGAPGACQRVRITVNERASLGVFNAKVSVKLSVDGIERERVVPVRGEVVGDMTWTPKVVDATRHPSRGGMRFSPVTIRSTGAAPFEILEADAGSRFDVTYNRVNRAAKAVHYNVELTLRHDAPPGPFGTMLSIRTTSLDQPVIRLPVFGIVAEPVAVDPPVVMLRQDATPAGTVRRVKLSVLTSVKLEILQIECDSDAIEVALEQETKDRYQHLRYLIVKLVGRLPVGTHHSVLTVATNIEGAGKLKIPVIIVVPPAQG